MAEPTDPRVTELRRLRRGKGLASGMVANCPRLMADLGYEGNPGGLALLITGTLQRMGTLNHVEALRYAYGIKGTGVTSTERRSEFLATLAVVREPPTAEKWEEDAIDELLGRLKNGLIAECQFRVDVSVREGKFSYYSEEVVVSEHQSVTIFSEPFKPSESQWQAGIQVVAQVPLSIDFTVTEAIIEVGLLGEGEEPPTHAWAARGNTLPDLHRDFGTRPIEVNTVQGDAFLVAGISSVRPGEFIGLMWGWEED